MQPVYKFYIWLICVSVMLKNGEELVVINLHDNWE